MLCRGRKSTHTLIAKAIYEAPGAMVLVVCTVKCSEILAHIELPKNPRVNKVKGMLYAVRCLKSNEDMILTLAGQFKQLSHEPEKFR